MSIIHSKRLYINFTHHRHFTSVNLFGDNKMTVDTGRAREPYFYYEWNIRYIIIRATFFVFWSYVFLSVIRLRSSDPVSKKPIHQKRPVVGPTFKKEGKTKLLVKPETVQKPKMYF